MFLYIFIFPIFPPKGTLHYPSPIMSNAVSRFIIKSCVQHLILIPRVGAPDYNPELPPHVGPPEAGGCHPVRMNGHNAGRRGTFFRK